MRKILGLLAGTAIALGTMATAASASTNDSEVPGHEDRTGTVTGVYWAEDEGSDVLVQYRGDFEGNAYLDSGWIKNIYHSEDGTIGTYLIVHETDPRYTGNDERAIWGEWEIIVDTVSGTGNVANPMHPAYDY